MKYLFLIICFAALLSACTPSETKRPENIDVPPTTMMTANISFDIVEANLRQAIRGRELKLFTVVDHGEGANSVGIDIGQSKLFVFGNPQSGTPLMMANRAMGLELPMKILIFVNEEGEIGLRHTDILTLASQYGITDQEERIQKINMTLKEISTEALSETQ